MPRLLTTIAAHVLEYVVFKTKSNSRFFCCFSLIVSDEKIKLAKHVSTHIKIKVENLVFCCLYFR